MAKGLSGRTRGKKETEKDVQGRGDRGYVNGLNLMHRFTGIVDGKGKLQFASEATVEGLGYTDEEILERPFWEASWFAQSSESQTMVKNSILEALEGESTRCEVQAFTKDGTALPVIFNIGPLRGKVGEVVSIVAEAESVVEGKGIQELRSAEERLASVFELIQDAYFEADNGDRFTMISCAGAKLLGYESSDSLVGKRAAELWASSEERDKFLRRLSRDGRIDGYEVSLLKEDGTIIVVEADVHLLYNAKGEVRGSEGIFKDITEKTRHEKQLKKAYMDLERERSGGIKAQGRIVELGETERKYSALYIALVENAADGIGIMQDGILKFANTRLVELAGYHAIEDVEGKSISEIISGTHDVVGEICVEKVKASEMFELTEMDLITSDGETIPVEASGALVEYECKPATMFIVRDITSRKQLEKEIRRYHERFSMIVEAVNDGIVIIDGNFNVLYANEKMCGMIQYTPEDFERISKHPGGTAGVLSSVLGADDPEAIAEMIGRFAERMDAQNTKGMLSEIKLGRKDGTTFLAEVSTAIVDWNNESAAVVIVRDITERNKAEEAAREAEKRFNAIFNNQLHMVYLYDQFGHFIDANEYSLKRLGYTSDEVQETLLSDVIVPEDLEKAVLSIGEVMADEGMLRPLELRLRTKWGEDVWIECLSVNVENDEQRFIGMGIAREITERKQAEEELRVSEERLRGLVERLKLSQEELSTPVIQVWDRVLVLPLIGIFDTDRAQRVMEVLLGRIVETQSEMVIVDVTGVAAMDTEVTNHLIRTVQSTALLGARCVITGINPDVAQAMAQLGIDMTKLITKRDMQDGLMHGLRTMGYELRTR